MMPDLLLQRFTHLTRRDPLRPLVTDGRRSWSRREVAELARAVARPWESGSVGGGLVPEPSTLAALRAPNGVAFLAGWLALRQVGAAVLPLETAGDDHAVALGARGVLECTEVWPRGPKDFCWRALRTVGDEEAQLPAAAQVVKLTSGSTGSPRGVMVTSEALVADDAAGVSSMGLVDDDRILTVIPMGHSYGLACVTVPVLARGCTLLLPPGDAGPLAAWSAADRLEATFFPTAPAYAQALTKLAVPPPFPRALRRVITAGATLAPATAVRFQEIYDRSIHVLYGASECGGACYDREGTAAREGTVGSAMDGVAVALEPSPDGYGDVLAVTSLAVALGYLEATGEGGAQPIIDERLSGGRFRSSDLAAFRGQRVALLGRCDDLINVRGKKVYPREVEAVLRRLPGVDDVVAVGVELPGGKDQLVRAVVECRPGSLSDEEIRRHCRTHLSRHKVPRSLILVERLPRTGRGKIDRRALRQVGWGLGRPSVGRPSVGRPSVGRPSVGRPRVDSPELETAGCGDEIPGEDPAPWSPPIFVEDVS